MLIMEKKGCRFFWKIGVKFIYFLFIFLFFFFLVKIKIIFMDLNMPIMDGFVATKNIRNI